MGISGWSADVCSAYLRELVGQEGRAVAELGQLELGRICEPRAEAEQRVFHVRIVVMIAGRVGVVERERRFDRDIGLRLRKAAEQVELETVGQPPFEPQRKLRDFGIARARIAFGADLEIRSEESGVGVEGVSRWGNKG